MKKTTRILLSLVALASVPAFAQNAAVVNGKPIPASHVNAIVKEVVQQGQPDSPELRASVKENLIMREVLVQEAEKRKLGANPAVKNQIEMTRRNILVRALMSDFVSKNPVSDAEIKKTYDQLKAQAGDTEYQVSHILVKSQDEAKTIIEQLKNGGNFDEIAREKSTDAPTAAKGGDLGWSAPHVYVDPFAQALIKLKKGEYSQEPVQTNFGYHIILVEDTRELSFPTLEAAKPGITQRIQEQKWEAYTQTLRTQAKVR